MPENLSHEHILSLQADLFGLATDIGFNASGKEEVYGCLFGRDSAITILSILQALESQNSFIDSARLLALCKQTLLTLVDLQGQTVNIESGEEPGKFIHEYRTEKYERLLLIPKPWYIYPDGVLRNYDSIDSTPLALIALYKYYAATQDDAFLLKVLPAVEKGLNWIISYGDRDKDFLLEYELPIARKSGGLLVQSWTDSHESLLRPDGSLPLYPIAPVEAQGYAWLALRLWAAWYKARPDAGYRTFASRLQKQAKELKKNFNRLFVFKDTEYYFLAQALDGEKQQIQTITGNPLLTLWATDPQANECIVMKKYIPDIVARAFQTDMFDPDAGIRTMSVLAPAFNPGVDSYHNGSFWPVLNGLAYEGLRLWKFDAQADLLKQASLKPFVYFNSPIELYLKHENGEYAEFCGSDGQKSCKVQAWSAAAFLHLYTDD
jgi:glycogen debranching enzyme